MVESNNDLQLNANCKQEGKLQANPKRILPKTYAKVLYRP